MTRHGTHITTIVKLREQSGSSKSALKVSSSEGREETNEGDDSDYSELSEVDEQLFTTVDEGSDADEDESAQETGSDPKSETTMVLPSLFAGRPPTVWFEYALFAHRKREQGREQIFELTSEQERPLLFRSNHTIICLGGALKRSGFRRLLKGTTYNVFWGHHLKEAQLQRLHPHQYVNHFPGSYQLGRKDYLWKNISKQARAHGQAYDFCAKSYVLPRDRELLHKDYEDGQVYIVKPPASAEGRGIRLVNRYSDFPRPNQPAVVQQYIANPHLIDGKKYDCRIYIAVTSFDPLRAYMYDEGLVRFATSDYKSDHTTKSIRNRYMHLTNYSVNKRSAKFVCNTDADLDDQGSKWSLSALWKYLEELEVDVSALKARIRDIAVKTLIAGEHSIVSKVNQAGRPSCFELFGFDILLDQTFKPWLIEVNVTCSLASSSPLDRRVKHFMMTDLLHMVGVAPYDRRRTKEAEESSQKSRLLHGNTSGIKHRNVFELQETPLHKLGAEDLEIIATAEDENARRGDWSRVFPCEGMGKVYLPLFECARYRNTVLSKWMDRQDWSLLASMLNPALPADHICRKLAAEPPRPPPSERSEGGGFRSAAKRLAAAAEEARSRQAELRHKRGGGSAGARSTGGSAGGEGASTANGEGGAEDDPVRHIRQLVREATMGATRDLPSTAPSGGPSPQPSQPSNPPMALGCTTGASSAFCAPTSVASPISGAAGCMETVGGHSSHASSAVFGLAMGFSQGGTAGALGMVNGLGTTAALYAGVHGGAAQSASAGSSALTASTSTAAVAGSAPLSSVPLSAIDTSTFASRLHQLMRRGDTPPSAGDATAVALGLDGKVVPHKPLVPLIPMGFSAGTQRSSPQAVRATVASAASRPMSPASRMRSRYSL